ncbi:hypothetical protein EW145_g1917 [Phellinidium pouzarii]|uniref:non-reducing end alpha-L-arabinofuranosidase n=1 Tax=Phellinidium pouzarii TaxID=167371 RepID=A0A4S4LCR5_9AGAM|nr:hypothetical protein EW145_g1917 [Phellinidium pouzarii]
MYSGDGGLYAEMLQNRAFQRVMPGASDALAAWSAVGGAQISVVDSTTPLSSALPNSLQIQVSTNTTEAVGLANSGYFGINVNSSWTYNASFFFKFAEGSTFDGSLTASLVALDGTVLASSSEKVSGAHSTNWTEFSVKLRPSMSGSNTNNSFTVTLDSGKTAIAAGETAFFSMFSLFPPTYKGRENGMRVDIAQALADMKPAFFRFPGGNNLEGQSIEERWIWNNTVGPLVDRPGRLGDWGYINTEQVPLDLKIRIIIIANMYNISGLGLKEYLDFIEDEGMQSIMAVWAGYSFGGTVAEADLATYIQAAIDQINFVIGDPAKSEAAALRASLGHPEPYPLQWIEVGNEDFFAADTYGAYRWQDFVGNLSAEFPHLQFLATTDTFDPILTPTPQLYDIHVYQTPSAFTKRDYNHASDASRESTAWFAENSFIYDGFEGEYAAISTNANDIFGTPADGRFSYPTMSGSAGEAAFMTGLERNADIVFAASYAPLLQSVDDFQWTPNLISFDAGNVYLSTSYYIQKLFSLSKGTEYLPSTLPSTDGVVSWSVTRDTRTHEVFVKVVNTAAAAADLSFELPFHVSAQGSVQMLGGSVASANLSNTPVTPAAVVPQMSSVRVGSTFFYSAPGFSVRMSAERPDVRKNVHAG